MKRKIFAAIMFLTISGVTVPMTDCLQVMAQAAEESQETPDFAMLAGVWTSQDDSEETLTLTGDGLFVYHKADGDTQGYMEYVEESFELFLSFQRYLLLPLHLLALLL